MYDMQHQLNFRWSEFSRKLSKLRLLFSLCNYVTYIHTSWQSIDSKVWMVFIFSIETPYLEKKHQGYSLSKWGIEVGNGIEPFNIRIIRIHVCPETTWQKLESQRV